MTTAPTRRCESCQSEAAFAPLFGRADLVRCGACGGWSFRGDVPADPETLYDEAYFNGAEYSDYQAGAAAHRLNFRRKLRLVLRHARLAPADVRLVELGCATGEFLAVAAEAGATRLLGIEASEYCRGIAARRGLDVRAPGDPATDAAVQALRPNVVVGWDVWEHLPRPAEVFDAILARAAPDATIAISTVDAGSAVARVRGARWRQLHPPTHLQYPTRRSLALYLASRGFAVAHHRSFGYYRPLLEYARGLGLHRLRRGPATAFPWSVPVYLNLGDIQLAVARRAA